MFKFGFKFARVTFEFDPFSYVGTLFARLSNFRLLSWLNFKVMEQNCVLECPVIHYLFLQLSNYMYTPIIYRVIILKCVVGILNAHVSSSYMDLISCILLKKR